MGDCEEWDGWRNERGYGRTSWMNRRWYVHRLQWALVNGPIPDGLCVLHRCDNPPCFAIEHLFLGTRTDNVADMVAKGRRRAKPTHCPQGHEFTPENCCRPVDGASVCRTCKNANARARRVVRRSA